MCHVRDESFAHIAFPSPDRPKAPGADGKLAVKGMRCGMGMEKGTQAS